MKGQDQSHKNIDEGRSETWKPVRGGCINFMFSNPQDIKKVIYKECK